MLAPALAVVALVFPAEAGQRRDRIGLPWFVIGFLVLGAVNSFAILPAEAVGWAKTATQSLLLLAVTAIGIRSPMNLLLNQGWRSAVPVIAATLVAFGLSLAAALLIA